MVKIDASTNVEELSKALRTLGSKQLPFAFALMATRLALLVKKASFRLCGNAWINRLPPP